MAYFPRNISLLWSEKFVPSLGIGTSIWCLLEFQDSINSLLEAYWLFLGLALMISVIIKLYLSQRDLKVVLEGQSARIDEEREENIKINVYLVEYLNKIILKCNQKINRQDKEIKEQRLRLNRQEEEIKEQRLKLNIQEEGF